MPIIKSAIKRMKQTLKRKARNQATKRNLKGAVKSFTAEPTAESLKAAQSKIDTAVKKGQLNKNTAARRKANLVKAAKAAGVKPVAAKKTAAKPAAAKTTAAKPAAAKKAAPAKAAAKKPAAKKPATKKADK